MKIGLVGFPGSGKTTVFNALTGCPRKLDTAPPAARPTWACQGSRRARRRPGETVQPKKTTYAEIAFSDVAAAPAGAEGQGLDEKTLAPCAKWTPLPCGAWFSGPSGEAPALGEAKDFEVEMNSPTSSLSRSGLSA